MKLTVNECFELDTDYQSQFLGKEVFPEPNYKKLKVVERSVNKVHYENIYLLEPQHYYYVTFKENFEGLQVKLNTPLLQNGLVVSVLDEKMYLFNASQNIIYLQKGVSIAEV